MWPKTLRSYALSLLALLPLAAFAADSSGSVAQLPAPAPVNPSGFVIHRGTNLSHWLSQDFGWAPRESWITEQDLQFIARQGFDHVRLPIDEKELWRADGGPIEKEFARLLQAIDWARKAGLRVIVDLHTINAHHFNAANEGLTNTLWSDPRAQEHFVALWRELSTRLHHLPVDAVAYEILNEPVADNHADWNRLIATTLHYIRSVEPQRVVVVGANRWQIPSNLPFLEVPAGDRNIILSFHTYSPMLFTHHLANWVPIKTYTGRVSYPGPIIDRATYDQLMKNPDRGFTDLVGGAAEEWNAARLRQEFEPALRRARELGLQLYCGEFGCMPTVPRADRLAYYRDIVSVFVAEGIAWANWEYKGDFGLYQWNGVPALCGAPDAKLIEALMQKR